MRISWIHIVVVIVVLVLLFGARRLPDLAKSVGQSMKIFKNEMKDLAGDSDTDKREQAPAQPVPVQPPTPPAAHAPAPAPAPGLLYAKDPHVEQETGSAGQRRDDASSSS